MGRMQWLTCVLGSFADMPTDLKAQIDRLEELFMVPTDKLKAISDHFVTELEKGLSKEGGSIVGRTSPTTQELCADASSP
jgi:hexokinase